MAVSYMVENQAGERESGLKTTPAQITADGNADRLEALRGMWRR